MVSLPPLSFCILNDNSRCKAKGAVPIQTRKKTKNRICWDAKSMFSLSLVNPDWRNGLLLTQINEERESGFLKQQPQKLKLTAKPVLLRTLILLLSKQYIQSEQQTYSWSAISVLLVASGLNPFWKRKPSSHTAAPLPATKQRVVRSRRVSRCLSIKALIPLICGN